MNNFIIVPVLYPVDNLEPIDPQCKKCGHSFKNHDRIQGCKKGVFNKCPCSRFEFDNESFIETKKEIETILYKHVAEAKRLENVS